jgi:hypothetical protein
VAGVRWAGWHCPLCVSDSPGLVTSQHAMIQLIRSYELMNPGQIGTFPLEGSERHVQSAAERAVAH